MAAAKVIIFGLGGVGSFAAEALARSGIGHLVLVDPDRVSITNLNRQLPATLATLGQLKVEVMKRRIAEINPRAVVETFPVFYLPGKGREFFTADCDYIVDAVDTVAAKIDLIVRAREMGIPIVSSMGAGNRLDPGKFLLTDISATHTCPLARVIRRELRRAGITSGVKVVFSTEPPIKPGGGEKGTEGGKQVPGSIAFVPPVAGLLLAGAVVRGILGLQDAD